MVCLLMKDNNPCQSLISLTKNVSYYFFPKTLHNCMRICGNLILKTALLFQTKVMSGLPQKDQASLVVVY